MANPQSLVNKRLHLGHGDSSEVGTQAELGQASSLQIRRMQLRPVGEDFRGRTQLWVRWQADALSME